MPYLNCSSDILGFTSQLSSALSRIAHVSTDNSHCLSNVWSRADHNRLLIADAYGTSDMRTFSSSVFIVCASERLKWPPSGKFTGLVSDILTFSAPSRTRHVILSTTSFLSNTHSKKNFLAGPKSFIENSSAKLALRFNLLHAGPGNKHIIYVQQ